MARRAVSVQARRARARACAQVRTAAHAHGLSANAPQGYPQYALRRSVAAGVQKDRSRKGGRGARAPRKWLKADRLGRGGAKDSSLLLGAMGATPRRYRGRLVDVYGAMRRVTRSGASWSTFWSSEDYDGIAPLGGAGGKRGSLTSVRQLLCHRRPRARRRRSVGVVRRDLRP